MVVTPDNNPLVLVCDDDSMQRVLTTEEVNELDGLVRESLRQLLAAYVRLRSEFASDEDQ